MNARVVEYKCTYLHDFVHCPRNDTLADVWIRWNDVFWSANFDNGTYSCEIKGHESQMRVAYPILVLIG